MKNIDDYEIHADLPKSLQRQNVMELAELVDRALHLFDKKIHRVLIYPVIDQLDGDLVDALAIQLHCDFYDKTLPLEARRQLVKTSIAWHRIKGTPAAVEMLTQAVFPNSYTREWFEYGGRPYFFRMVQDLSGGEEVVTRQTLDLLRKAISMGKNVRSWLELLEFTMHLTDDIDYSDEVVSFVNLRKNYEDWVPYGKTPPAAKYDGSLQYGGMMGYDYSGMLQHDGTWQYNAFAPRDAPQFGKEIAYHFRYNGLAVFDREFPVDGSIRYDGYKPYQLEYEAEFDDLHINVIRLGKRDEPTFEDWADADCCFDGTLQFSGGAQYGKSSSAIDAEGNISVRRFHRFDGRMNYSGGDINYFDGSICYNGLFDMAGGGNRFATAQYEDNISGSLTLKNHKKNKPLIDRWPEIEDDVPYVSGLYAAQLDAGAIADECLTLYMRCDGNHRYDGSIPFKSEILAPLDSGGNICMIKGRCHDGAIDYAGGNIYYADSTHDYSGIITFDGGGRQFNVETYSEAL